ncbi:MAG: DnaB-like helicase C-terminal domain-containing protein [Gemmatimonas sp.]
MSDPSAIPTAFPSLDKTLGGGLRMGDLIVLGGDAGSGTSALSLAIALKAGVAGSLFMTSEMSSDRVAERALAMEARVLLSDIRSSMLSAEDEENVAAAATRLRYLAPVVRTLQGGGTTEVAKAVGELPNVRLVVVDGLEALITDPINRDDQMSFALLSLKRLAVVAQVAVLLVTHLPRLDRQRNDRRPRLDDFGVNGSVTVHADTVLGLYREEIYMADMAVEGAAELLVLKRRDGGPGYVDLYFYPQWLRFEDVLETGG